MFNMPTIDLVATGMNICRLREDVTIDDILVVDGSLRAEISA